MGRDDAVFTRTFGGVRDSAACALWEGFLRCVRVLQCEMSSTRVAGESFKRDVMWVCSDTCVIGHLPTQAAHPLLSPWN